MDYKSIIMAQAFGGDGGGGVTVEPLEVTENGTYEESGKAYSPVTVNVSGGALETVTATLDGVLRMYYVDGNGVGQIKTDNGTVNVLKNSYVYVAYYADGGYFNSNVPYIISTIDNVASPDEYGGLFKATENMTFSWGSDT